MATLQTVMARLMFLENRGPDRVGLAQAPRGTDQVRKQPNKPATTTGPRLPDTTSVNSDFASVSKCLYRFVQLQHHAENWRKLPESLAKRMKKFASDINPPMPDAGLKEAIATAADEFGQRICAIVRRHLDAKLAVNEVEASTMDNRDLDKAKLVADKFLSTRLGRRIDGARKQLLLDDAATKIGAGRSRSVTTDGEGLALLAARPSTSKPAATTDDEGFVLPAARPTTGKRQRALSSPSSTPIPCSNPFAVLADESVEEDRQHLQRPQTPKKARRDSDVQPPSSGRTSRAARITRVPSRVHVHEGPKNTWSLEPSNDTRVLVIGDSNLRHVDATALPDDWEVHSFPGCKFKHVSAIASRCTPPTALKHVIVQVGINHRDEGVDSRPDLEIARMARFTRDLCKSVSVTGLSVADTLDSQALQMVGIINRILKDSRDLHYIEPLGFDEVGIADPLGSGIHHDEATVARIMSSMVAHVQSLN